MSNLSRQKGTVGENYFLSVLRVIWPRAERAPLKGVYDAGDFVNVPFPIESKHTKKPLFQQWVRILRPKASDHRFVLCWKGDMRTEDGFPLMVVDMRFGAELLALWEKRHHTGGTPPEMEGQESLW